jgi:transcriptional regulator with XRE-family HTH domain
MADEKWFPGKATIGSYIRAQHELSRLFLRELARISHVSNAYLSQVERGMHEPSLRVLAAVAEAL